MKKEQLYDAVGLLEADIIDEHFKLKDQLKRRRVIKSAALKFCAAAAVICIIMAGTMSPQIKERIVTSELFRMVFNRGGELTGEVVTTDISELPLPWERLEMSLGVRNRLLRAGDYDTKIAMTVSIRDEEAKNAFVYEGKSYAEYAAERDALKAKREELKNAEQTDEVKAETERLKEEIIHIADVITAASKAYSVKCAEELFELFYQKGYTVIRMDGTLHLYASYRELTKLYSDIGENVYFDIGKENIFLNKNETETNDTVLDDKTSEPNEQIEDKSYLKKIIRDEANITVNLTDDEDLVELIESMLKESCCDHLWFVFFCSDNTDEGVFENMNYFKMVKGKYPTSIRVEVYKENINIDALIELAKRNDIRSIIIAIPPLGTQ